MVPMGTLIICRRVPTVLVEGKAKNMLQHLVKVRPRMHKRAFCEKGVERCDEKRWEIFERLLFFYLNWKMFCQHFLCLLVFPFCPFINGLYFVMHLMYEQRCWHLVPEFAKILSLCCKIFMDSNKRIIYNTL